MCWMLGYCQFSDFIPGSVSHITLARHRSAKLLLYIKLCCSCFQYDLTAGPCLTYDLHSSSQMTAKTAQTAFLKIISEIINRCRSVSFSSYMTRGNAIHLSWENTKTRAGMLLGDTPEEQTRLRDEGLTLSNLRAWSEYIIRQSWQQEGGDQNVNGS